MSGGNIYLVGFMGAGKTSVGIRLAEILGREFIDLDREIEKLEGRSIREIFASEGEPGFRALERAALERVSRIPGCVVALGGGAFVDPANRAIVAATGVGVWLDVSLETLVARCAGDAARPLFAGRREMEQLLAFRRPFYEQAGLRIAADGLTIDGLVRRICDEIGKLLDQE